MLASTRCFFIRRACASAFTRWLSTLANFEADSEDADRAAPVAAATERCCEATAFAALASALIWGAMYSAVVVASLLLPTLLEPEVWLSANVGTAIFIMPPSSGPNVKVGMAGRMSAPASPAAFVYAVVGMAKRRCRVRDTSAVGRPKSPASSSLFDSREMSAANQKICEAPHTYTYKQSRA